MNAIAFGLVLVAFAGVASAAVEATIDSTWTSWPSTIYYLAHLQGPDSPYEDVTVNIVAVDEYTLYIDGKEVGSGVYTVDPATNEVKVDAWPVSIGGGDGFIIGVKVKNNGIGNGNGLMVDIEANTDWLGTTTMARRTHVPADNRIEYRVAWYYNFGDVPTDMGDDWYDQSEDFFLEITKHGFKQVMSGTMGNLEYNPDNHIEVVTGYPGNIDIGTAEGGGIRLRRVEGENLALGKPSQEEKLTDGDLANGYAFNQDPVGITKYLDLEAIRRVNKMILFTGGTNADTWDRDSVRGYSVQISLDQFRYEEVGVLHEIGISNKDEGGYDWYAINFPEEWARYLRFEITEPRIFYPNIGEVMVYGVGYVYNGIYESDWKNLDSANLKNFNTVTWSGDTPEGTRIVVQTKTRYELADGTLVESDWSVEHADTTFAFDSPEPATDFKYRTKLFTQDIDVTPTFDVIALSYSDTDQPVTQTAGYVSVVGSTVNQVPMGDVSEFEYTIEYTLNQSAASASRNIKTIGLSVPGESVVSKVSTSSSDSVAFSFDSTTDMLTVNLTDAVTSGNELKIYLQTKLLTNLHDFEAYLYNDQTPANDGAGGVKVWERSDKSWTVTTSTILDQILSNVDAVPKVFTPNNDNTNDFTVFEFTLAKVETDVDIKIFDTKGRLVYVKDCGVLTAKDHFFVNKSGKAGDAMNLPGYWDGKDEDGDLVPPGVYVYQVVADIDAGDEIEGGTVVVAY